MKAKVARQILAEDRWSIDICRRCDYEPVITVLHDRHYDQYDRFASKNTWEAIARPLSPSCCEAVKESVLVNEEDKIETGRTPDVGQLTLARWREGHWFAALNTCYLVCLQTGAVHFAPFTPNARKRAARNDDPWAREAYAVAAALNLLAGSAIRSAHDPDLNEGLLLLADLWTLEANSSD